MNLAVDPGSCDLWVHLLRPDDKDVAPSANRYEQQRYGSSRSAAWDAQRRTTCARLAIDPTPLSKNRYMYGSTASSSKRYEKHYELWR